MDNALRYSETGKIYQAMIKKDITGEPINDHSQAMGWTHTTICDILLRSLGWTIRVKVFRSSAVGCLLCSWHLQPVRNLLVWLWVQMIIFLSAWFEEYISNPN